MAQVAGLMIAGCRATPESNNVAGLMILDRQVADGVMRLNTTQSVNNTFLKATGLMQLNYADSDGLMRVENNT